VTARAERGRDESRHLRGGDRVDGHVEALEQRPAVRLQRGAELGGVAQRVVGEVERPQRRAAAETAKQATRHGLGVAVKARRAALRVQLPQRRHVTRRHQAVHVRVGEVATGKPEALERPSRRRQDAAEVVGEVVVAEVQRGEVRKSAEEANQPAKTAAVTARPDALEHVEGTVVESEGRQPVTVPAARQRPRHPRQAEVHTFQTHTR